MTLDPASWSFRRFLARALLLELLVSVAVVAWTVSRVRTVRRTLAPNSDVLVTIGTGTDALLWFVLPPTLLLVLWLIRRHTS